MASPKVRCMVWAVGKICLVVKFRFFHNHLRVLDGVIWLFGEISNWFEVRYEQIAEVTSVRNV